MPPAAPPTPHLDRTLTLYALAGAGGVIAYLPLLTLLLPIKVELLAGDARIAVLTATVLAGAIAASLSNIAFGWLSDRSVARGGGRRRWLAGGLVATALSYAAIAAATSAFSIVIGIVLFQIAVNAVLAPLFAMMADEIPDARKGVAGGLLALGSPLAAAVSALLVGLPQLDDSTRLSLIWLGLAGCVAPVLLLRFPPATPAPPAPNGDTMARRDLLAAWCARLLVQVAGNVLALYLLYYFESIAPGAGPIALAPHIGSLLTIAYIVPLPIAVLLGRLSDRSGRRKPFLLGAAATAAAGLVGMALATDWAAAAIAFCVYASGSAVFLALHAGFAMQLLPDPRHRGRDLGLLNLTNTLPALLGPLLTWLLAAPHDFDALMLALAALTLGGGLTILLVGGRR
jgi:MFS family permease